MRIARISLPTPDGPQARIVVQATDESPLVDVRRHYGLTLQRRGATPQAALDVAGQVVPGSLAAALTHGDLFLDALRAASEDTSGDAVAGEGPLLSPIDPASFRDFLAFEEHIVNAAHRSGGTVDPVVYEIPISYLGSAPAFIGPEATMPWPTYARSRMDYELELGIVIARGGRNILPGEADAHILGFTVLNDFSARDIQLREMGGRLGPSKGKHFASACGPVIVTPDELDPHHLTMTARVNGEVWSRGSTSTLMWSVQEMVAWASASEPLLAGSLLGSGTVGRGCGMELGREVRPGDVVELDIEGIGVLRNTVGHPDGQGWTPTRRPAVLTGD
ncbi:fumarylacetoacetate hydrolase [Deinococcus aerius]|uniref:Fumarylacetoacetate hydrolase n=1 Tax=Deinococcus aerius TaxID=200253 RepID=A0A2I9DRH3_9DEIO|nr:fumarylacetoacetate hydrolase family protein [Deinococcus aerius]GBF07991.1 fumarylacetoacetate hydrolase [Deinococcus aerius]